MNARVIKDNYTETEEEKRLQEEIKNLPYNIFLDHSLGQMYDWIIPLNNNPARWLAVNKFTDLDTLLLTALNCLSGGCKFDHKSFTVNNKDGIKRYTKEAEYHFNHHNLKSASAQKIRELANTIKHHGIFDLDETKREILHYTLTNPETGQTVSGKQIIARPSIGYAKLVEALIAVHKDIIEFEKYLLGELGLLDSTDIVDLSKPRPFIKKSFSART